MLNLLLYNTSVPQATIQLELTRDVDGCLPISIHLLEWRDYRQPYNAISMQGEGSMIPKSVMKEIIVSKLKLICSKRSLFHLMFTTVCCFLLFHLILITVWSMKNFYCLRLWEHKEKTYFTTLYWWQLITLRFIFCMITDDKCYLIKLIVR